MNRTVQGDGAARHSRRAPFVSAYRVPVPATSNKIHQRRILRARRLALSPEAQRLASRRLAAMLAGLPLFRTCRRIACYMPADGEIDPTPVMERIWRMRKTCYLPVLSRLSHDRLWFAPVTPGTELAANRYGILEPAVPARDLVRAQELDLILLPLVGFDARGNRLGMGGGFYDKSLEFLRHRRLWKKPHVLGLAHDFQKVAALVADPWDVPLQGVVTDVAVYTAEGG